MPIEYYLALLQLHIAVVSVVIAGIVALIQLLNNAKPHRDIHLLVQRRVLIAYVTLLLGLLLILALGAWTSAFPSQAQLVLGSWSISFFGDGRVALVIITLSMASLVGFGMLAIKARTLLDTQLYLKKYVEQVPAIQVHRYLAAIYYENADNDITKPQPSIPFDPFQPIREYIKDNAYKFYDYGTADGLKHFSALFDKAFKSVNKKTGQDQYLRLARYISESSDEFFTIFAKTASEKRKMDTINLLHAKGEKLLKAGNDGSLLPIIRGLENIAKLSDDDDEIIAAIGCIRRLSDDFLDSHKAHDWPHVAGPFDEICLSVTRITEVYYLQKNNSLKTVPIIGYSTGAHRTVTVALVDFFYAYRDLGDRYTDSRPVYYFEAIESVIEVLFVRLADIVESGQQNIGFNMKYHELARSLYDIYYAFGIDAIEHDKPELLTLSLSNLRRVIKPAKNFKLEAEQAAICTMIVELSIKGVTRFGDIMIKGDRTITDYAHETLDKHASQTLITAAMSTIEVAGIIIDTDPATDAESEPVENLIKRLQTIT